MEKQPHIARVIYDSSGRRIGAVADDTVASPEETERILDSAAQLLYEHLSAQQKSRTDDTGTALTCIDS